jgi:hypothetical protein
MPGNFRLVGLSVFGDLLLYRPARAPPVLSPHRLDPLVQVMAHVSDVIDGDDHSVHQRP